MTIFCCWEEKPKGIYIIHYIYRYSGSDICIIVKDAMMEPIRKCQRAKKFKKTQDGFWEPTNYSDPSGVEKTLFQIEDPSTVRAPIICYVRIIYMLNL